MSTVIVALFVCLIGLCIAPVLAIPAFARMLDRAGQSRWHAAAALLPYVGLIWILLRARRATALPPRETR